MTGYATPPGGLPPQNAAAETRAVFTESYAFLPASTMRGITTSRLPGWEATEAWIIARPLSGFAETFAHYLMETGAGGGSTAPEPDPGAEGVLFVTAGTGRLTLGGSDRALRAGSYAYLPPGADWALRAESALSFHWIRKSWEAAPGLAPPGAFVTHEDDHEPVPMPDTDGAWATKRFVDPGEIAHDMHVNIVEFRPGGLIPFPETHVMEHGLYVLEGKAVYRLNRDWVEVGPGDYMWLRAFCPQSCYAGGPGRFRYLLYKDVNRHPALRLR
ncbi:bifunctional allantoicase/(S)-ureidoglycine aminohydrolase [Wenxinia saemankumensis]|uniref:(S)-ureidoglycine aminohydrolase n=1 Tax=Wenxinia saemankumensis TaxID=1447782 RepID=A0A1M6CP51_9RHOB|nr:bifunctional allantoicase/(S)-ureidoglycine aminohydrolase [Wenxinia saemankumensis]SHI62787.1 (S)-ureidoglycine aminohydrolase [Wenxinia saemankumensis]